MLVSSQLSGIDKTFLKVFPRCVSNYLGDMAGKLENGRRQTALIAQSIELTANGQRVKLTSRDQCGTGAEPAVRFEPVQEYDRRLVSALAYLTQLADSKPEEEITPHE